MATDGARGVCPLCRTALATSPSESVAEERRCPRCEAGLWALALPSGPAFFVRRPGQSAAGFLAGLLGASAGEVDSFLRGADPLDRVEFLDELEAAESLPMSEPADSPGPVMDEDRGPRSPGPRRWVRAVKWLLLGLATLVLVAYALTATLGTRAVRAAIRAESAAGYRAIKARAPGAVAPTFGGPEIAACRAILPGLISCRYSVTYGGRAAAVYEDLYLWDGRRCTRLRHETILVV